VKTLHHAPPRRKRSGARSFPAPQGAWALAVTEHAPECKRCGTLDVELRRCSRNGGVALACIYCNQIVGNWIPHDQLQGIDVASLPEWRVS
jgi:hypothetical protein